MLCPSCEKKRSLLWAEWLKREVLASVPHRHVVFTIPRLLRPLLRRRRELLTHLAQCAAAALSEYSCRELGSDARAGIVVSIATAGDLVQWHPHLHILVTDGAFGADGGFRPLAAWDAHALMALFRERLLARLVEQHAISQALSASLLSWKHPGFSAHVGEPIQPGQAQALEDIAGYVVRTPAGRAASDAPASERQRRGKGEAALQGGEVNPLSLKRLV